jgi:hypothetical protein
LGKSTLAISEKVKEKKELMAGPLLRFKQKWREQDHGKGRKGSGSGSNNGSRHVSASRKCHAMAKRETLASGSSMVA